MNSGCFQIVIIIFNLLYIFIYLLAELKNRLKISIFLWRKVVHLVDFK